MDLKSLLNTDEYSFLRSNERLGDRIMLLGPGGSYAYGTNNAGSDIGLRGVSLQLPSDLLGMTEFEQFADDNTDTVIYGFNKYVKLLLECNPNILELLGLDEDQYVIKSDWGQALFDNRTLFLSKRAIPSFTGFADAQIRRLQNAAARDRMAQSEKERHILNSVTRALHDFNRRHANEDWGRMRLYIDKTRTPGRETEIFADVSCGHFPLRGFADLLGSMTSVLRSYDKVGKWGKPKDKDHLNKHAMHAIRLLVMGQILFEKGEIRTQSEEDLPVLKAIRSGEYMLPDETFTQEFYDLLQAYTDRFRFAAEHTILPEEPDMAKIERFVQQVNRYAATGKPKGRR